MASLGLILLAAGQARRFGGQKLLAPLRGKPIAQHAIDTLSAFPFALKVLVTNEVELGRRGRDAGFVIAPSPLSEHGKSFSIRAGLRELHRHGKLDGVLFAVADQPFLKVETVHRLASVFVQHPEHIVVPVYKDKRGNPVFFPASTIPQLEKLEGDEGGNKLLKTHPFKEVLITDRMQAYDIDRFEDLKKLLEH